MAEDLFRTGKAPKYPRQLELPPWAPGAKGTEAERRADFARFLFEHEKTYREEGTGGHPLLCLDEAKGFFRFGDGTFALSRDRANWPTLKDAGFFKEWGM